MPVWNGSAWVYQGIKNAQVDAAAAIAYSKLSLAASIVNSDLAPTYANYTPTWTGTSTNPAIGNGSITGRYMQIGKFIHAWVKIVAGSTTTFGTGNYVISLPVAQSASIPVNFQMGVATTLDSSAGAVYQLLPLIGAGALVLAVPASPLSQFAGSAVPFAYAASDALYVNVTYEAA